jgi:ATP-dependent protease HslVU (ClpYQ) peptidase subunit
VTCIVGLVDNGQVYIGGDSAGVSGWDLVQRSDRKVFRNGDFVMGFTSSFRMGQLLAFGFNPPKLVHGADVFAYMVTEFVDAARQRLKDGGFATTKDSADIGGHFLVGVAGRLFNIASDYQVGESVHGYDACGCGGQIAMGSLRSTRLWSDPKARVHEALEAGEAFSAAVRGPFFIEKSERLS